MAFGFNANIEGNRVHRSRFANRYKNADKEFQDVFRKCVEKIFESSQFYVPVDREDLKNSGKIIENERNGETSSYTIRYGDGLDHPYALIVEKREFAPSGALIKHLEPTRAFYMKTAWEDNEAYTRATMREAVKRLNRKLAK